MSKNTPPLWLPTGSVRAVLALIVVVGSVIAAFYNPDAADRLLPVSGLAIGFYFKVRTEES